MNLSSLKDCSVCSVAHDEALRQHRFLPSPNERNLACVPSANIPTIWLTGCLTPAPKQENALLSSTIRPVVLLPSLMPIFRATLGRKISLEISQFQAAKGISPTDQTFILHSLCKKPLANKKCVYFVFTDFSTRSNTTSQEKYP